MLSLRSLVSQSYLSTSMHLQLHEFRREGSRFPRLEHVNYRTNVVSVRASRETEGLQKCFDLSSYVGSINPPFSRLTNPQKIVEVLYSGNPIQYERELLNYQARI